MIGLNICNPYGRCSVSVNVEERVPFPILETESNDTMTCCWLQIGIEVNFNLAFCCICRPVSIPMQTLPILHHFFENWIIIIWSIVSFVPVKS